MNEHRRSRPLAVVMLGTIALILSLAAPMVVSSATFTIALPKVVGGLSAPTQVTNAGDGSNRLFVVEKRGTIRVVQNGALKSGYFLDIRSKVADDGERGLLGLAFSPNFSSDHHLYVYFTRNGGDIVLARYTTNSARTKVVASSYRPLMLIEHSSQSNHNGGALAFGPNGYLYIGVGDGGGSGDPGNDAQEKSSTFLGKILRINVNGSGAGRFNDYSIPSSNPFAGSTPGFGEIWAYGLRNPWRISFDRATGSLFIADVGQDAWEEIDREGSGSTGGRNYGWSYMEGDHCYKPAHCPMAGDTLPVAEYSHAGGNCAITGGYVYRGTAQAKLIGLYVFADWCSGRIWTMAHDGSTITLRRNSTAHITSFGEAENGELFAVTSGGSLVRVRAP
jgi:glucose/arabinose dehydrogenase